MEILTLHCFLFWHQQKPRSKQVEERVQPTGNLQKILVLLHLPGALCVDGFGQQDDQEHQETQEQDGAQCDDKRHVPRRGRINILLQDLVGDPGL